MSEIKDKEFQDYIMSDGAAMAVSNEGQVFMASMDEANIDYKVRCKKLEAQVAFKDKVIEVLAEETALLMRKTDKYAKIPERVMKQSYWEQWAIAKAKESE